MFKPSFYFLLAVAFAYFSYLFGGSSTLEEIPISKPPPQWPGKNNTVLFLTNSEHGLANVLLATSHALLVEHPDLDIHFVSFPPLRNDIITISNSAPNTESSKTKPITFHELKGPSFAKTLGNTGFFIDQAINAPGIDGLDTFCSNMQLWLMPWTAPEYLDIYNEISTILETVDPVIVAADPLFGPGIDAVRAQGRNHAIISPNSLKDNFAQLQPLGAALWKYPAMSSAYPYPVPWYLIPSNIYMNLRLAYSVLVAPLIPSTNIAIKRSFLTKNGIAKPLDFFNVYHPSYPWITQSSTELDYPISTIPPNVHQCGPIYLSTSPASSQDSELTTWLSKAPTVLINLGSHVNYDLSAATEMALAIRSLLDNSPVQVLWKYNPRPQSGNFTSSFPSIITPDLKSGRIKMSSWLPVEPAALLETGHIIASVHHGGANCFHEAIGTGVPQVVLPMWVDLYDYAVRVEYLGVGVWGSRDAAPYWKAEELSRAFLKVVGDGEEAISMRKRARELSAPYKEKPGRVTAANELAKLARLP